MAKKVSKAKEEQAPPKKPEAPTAEERIAELEGKVSDLEQKRVYLDADIRRVIKLVIGKDV